MAITDTKHRFADNLERLIGFHRLKAKEAARLIPTDPATFSQWLNSRRQPSLELAIRVTELFEVSPDRLMTVEWFELVQNELQDPERFKRVEQRIKRGGSRMQAVPSTPKKEKVTHIPQKKGGQTA